ncbi:hypothetical protein J2TS4_08200 [Paenibacillus sp. J2TS4]|nr:hypothetical protein J2TS4_08200 [Paenibacillus sp. J2TS4]
MESPNMENIGAPYKNTPMDSLSARGTIVSRAESGMVPNDSLKHSNETGQPYLRKNRPIEILTKRGNAIGRKIDKKRKKNADSNTQFR